MKTKLLSLTAVVVLVFSLVAFLPQQNIAIADATDTVRTVSVNGEGKITVTPDLAYINLGVEVQNKNAAIAQQENAKQMTAVIDALKKEGIKPEDIKTTSYNLYQTYNYKENGEQGELYYISSNSVNVKINDVTKVGKIADIATLAGANTINSIQFTVKDDSVYYQEALKLAMTSAQSKATAIMSSFGKKPGLPLSVSETSYGGRVYYEYAPAKAMDSAMASTPIESGEITITANVSVQYDY